MTLPDAVGLVGVALYVGAYAGLQLGKLGLADWRYTALNAAGGLAVIYSLVWSFNLAAFVTQVLWLVFTVAGYLRMRRQQELLTADLVESGYRATKLIYRLPRRKR